MDQSQDNDPGMDILRNDAKKVCENAGLSIEDNEIDAMTRIINKNLIREFEYEKKVAKTLKKQSTVALKEKGENSTPMSTKNEEVAAMVLPKGDDMRRIINKYLIREFEYDKKVAKTPKKQSTVALKEKGENSTPMNTENEEGAAMILPKGGANADGAAKQPNEKAKVKRVLGEIKARASNFNFFYEICIYINS